MTAYTFNARIMRHHRFSPGEFVLPIDGGITVDQCLLILECTWRVVDENPGAFDGAELYPTYTVRDRNADEEFDILDTDDLVRVGMDQTSRQWWHEMSVTTPKPRIKARVEFSEVI